MLAVYNHSSPLYWFTIKDAWERFYQTKYNLPLYMGKKLHKHTSSQFPLFQMPFKLFTGDPIVFLKFQMPGNSSTEHKPKFS